MARNNKNTDTQKLLEEKQRDSALFEEKNIGDTLSASYANLVIKVSTEPDDASYNSLVDILTHSKDFVGFKSVHGNEEGAKRFIEIGRAHV